MLLLLHLWPMASVADLPQDSTMPQAVMRESRLDLHADPLPQRATARLGSVRFHHQGDIIATAFSPDGKVIVAACNDEKGLSLRFWETPTGKELSRVHVDEYRFADGLRFTPDGKGLLLYRATPRLYDCASGKLLRSFQGVGHAYAYDVSPDGRILATQVYVGPDYLIHLWEIATGKELRRLSGQSGSPLGLRFSSDSARLMSANESGGIWIWNVTSGKMVHQEMLHQTAEGRGRVALARNGRTAAIAIDAGVPGVEVLDVVTGKKHCQIIAEGYQLEFTPDSRGLVTKGPSTSPILWDVATGKKVRQLPDCLKHRLAGLSSDGKLLATIKDGQADSSILLWDIERAELIHHGGGHWGTVTSVAFAPNGKLVATGGEDATVRIWNPDTSKELATLKGHKEYVLAVAFAPEGKLLASTAADGTTRLWEVPSGRPLAKLDGPEGGRPTYARSAYGTGILRFSADGKTLTIGGLDGPVQVWDLAVAKCSRSFALGPQNTVVALERNTILTVSAIPVHGSFWASPGNLGLWSTTPCKQLRQLASGDGLSCWAAAISADNRIIVSAHSRVQYDGRAGIDARDHTIRLWERSTAEQIVTIKASRINTLAFSGDSRLFAAGHGNNFSWFKREVGRDITLWHSLTGEKLHTLTGHTDEIACLAFAPDSKRLASGSADHTVLIWDELPSPQEKTLRESPADKQRETWWRDLGGNAAHGYKTMSRLLQHPGQTVLLLSDKLKPAAPVDTKRIGELIKALDSGRYADRQEATKALEVLGDQAEFALRKSLAGNPSLECQRRIVLLLEKVQSVPATASELRVQRSLAILEWINNHESRRLLAALANGAPEARQTRLAQEAMNRRAKK
jgi:WD40 repeat protein